MFSQTLLFELRDVHFYTKERNWSSTDLPCLATKHASATARSSSSITSDLLDFHTNKTEQY